MRWWIFIFQLEHSKPHAFAFTTWRKTTCQLQSPITDTTKPVEASPPSLFGSTSTQNHPCFSRLLSQKRKRHDCSDLVSLVTSDQSSQVFQAICLNDLWRQKEKKKHKSHRTLISPLILATLNRSRYEMSSFVLMPNLNLRRFSLHGNATFWSPEGVRICCDEWSWSSMSL